MAGLFGMNIKLPLEDSDSGFIWALLLVVGSSVVAYVVLRAVGVLKKGD